MRVIVSRAFTSAVFVLAAAAGSAANAAYPERPITMIVPYAAGGATDVLGRALAPFISKYLGGNANVIVMNRPGAGGDLGVSAIARAPADGYTIGLVSTPPLLTLPLERKTTYTWKSFDYLGNVIEDPVSFAVHSDSKFKNMADLIAHAKAKPGEVTVGTTGPGSDDHLGMLMLERSAGVKFNHVPFKGSSEVRTAVLSNVINVAAINVSEGVMFVKGGSPMRNLGQATVDRSPIAPDLPTYKEQGFNVTLSANRALGAPAGLPADVKAKLVKAVEQAVADPEFQRQANTVFFQPVRYSSPAEFEASLHSLSGDFDKLWKEVPWKDN